MLKQSEKAKIADQVKRMLGTFSSRTIEPESTVYFVEDVAEFSYRAIEATIVAFRRGEIPDRNPAFPPSVAEFVTAVRRRQAEIDVAEFWDKTDFIEEDTPMWRALVKLRGRSMPTVENKGRVGWYVLKEDVAAVPRQLVEEERALLERREPRSVLPMLQRMVENG